jgi:hypothetical protein
MIRACMGEIPCRPFHYGGESYSLATTNRGGVKCATVLINRQYMGYIIIRCLVVANTGCWGTPRRETPSRR